MIKKKDEHIKTTVSKKKRIIMIKSEINEIENGKIEKNQQK